MVHFSKGVKIMHCRIVETGMEFTTCQPQSTLRDNYSFHNVYTEFYYIPIFLGALFSVGEAQFFSFDALRHEIARKEKLS